MTDPQMPKRGAFKTFAAVLAAVSGAALFTAGLGFLAYGIILMAYPLFGLMLLLPGLAMMVGGVLLIGAALRWSRLLNQS